MNNQEIRTAIKAARKKGIFQWQIAQAMGIQEERFSKMLRYEVSNSTKSIIVKVISDLENTRNGEM